MTEQERINIAVQAQIAAQNARIDTVLAKVDTIIGEMRDRDNQRAAEITELRKKHDADITELRKKHDADIKELNEKIDSKFDKLSAQIQNLTIAAIVGIGAIVLGGGAIVWAAITSLR